MSRPTTLPSLDAYADAILRRRRELRESRERIPQETPLKTHNASLREAARKKRVQDEREKSSADGAARIVDASYVATRVDDDVAFRDVLKTRRLGAVEASAAVDAERKDRRTARLRQVRAQSNSFSNRNLVRRREEVKKQSAKVEKQLKVDWNQFGRDRREKREAERAAAEKERVVASELEAKNVFQSLLEESPRQQPSSSSTSWRSRGAVKPKAPSPSERADDVAHETSVAEDAESELEREFERVFMQSVREANPDFDEKRLSRFRVVDDSVLEDDDDEEEESFDVEDPLLDIVDTARDELTRAGETFLARRYRSSERSESNDENDSEDFDASEVCVRHDLGPNRECMIVESEDIQSPKVEKTTSTRFDVLLERPELSASAARRKREKLRLRSDSRHRQRPSQSPPEPSYPWRNQRAVEKDVVDVVSRLQQGKRERVDAVEARRRTARNYNRLPEVVAARQRKERVQAQRRRREAVARAEAARRSALYR